MSNLSVAKCTQKYSIATISGGKKLPAATLSQLQSRKTRPTPPLKYRWSYTDLPLTAVTLVIFIGNKYSRALGIIGQSGR